MKIFKFPFYIIILLLFTSCIKPPIPQPVENTIAYYFLQNPEQHTNHLDSLLLCEDPWLTHDDIELYDWSSHTIHLNKNKYELLDEYFSGDTLIYPLKEQAFVICVNDSAVQKGSITPFFRAGSPDHPCITEIELRLFPKDQLSYFYPLNYENDKRNNDKLKKALENLELLHQGLEVELDKVYGIHFKDVNGTKSISYQIKVKNNDENDLYILDPEKIGSDLFRHYNNTIHFEALDGQSDATCSDYPAVDNPPDSSQHANLNMYQCLASGDSCSLKINVDHYSNFQNGRYAFYLWYCSPLEAMDHSKIILEDARIWTGWMWLPYYEMTYTGDSIAQVIEMEL